MIWVGAGAAAALRDKAAIKVQGWNSAGAVVNPTRKYQGTHANRTSSPTVKAQGP
jgi:hypothetical protein